LYDCVLLAAFCLKICEKNGYGMEMDMKRRALKNGYGYGYGMEMDMKRRALLVLSAYFPYSSQLIQ